MKKFLAAAFAAVMMLSLAACGKSGISGAGDWNYTDEDVEVYENQGGTSTYEGGMGSAFKTAWFDFVVTDAYLTDKLSGYDIYEGYKLLVVEIKLRNTFDEPVPMYDTDFMINWGGIGEEGRVAYPIEVNEPITDEQLPAEYDIEKKEIKTGTIIFEVPEDEEDFSFVFLEYYEDGSEGNYYMVNFTAEEK